MCDCYEGYCAGCGREIPVHIGDFSTNRQNVEIYCWKSACRETLLARMVGRVKYIGTWQVPEYAPKWEILKRGENSFRTGDGKMIFTDTIKHNGKDRVVVFLVTLPRSISVNG